jgi:starch synthase (maltosyl-transferring)
MVDSRPVDRQIATPEIPQALGKRVVIERIAPDVDNGRFPIKRTVGEPVTVTADIFADGHDVVVAVLRHRQRNAEGGKAG